MVEIISLSIQIFIDSIVTALQMIFGFPIAVVSLAYEELKNPINGELVQPY